MERHRSGAISEAYVVYRLSELGYEIFIPMMTQSRADFIVIHENKCYKVQVKKASWSTAHEFEYLQCRIHGKSKRDPKKWYNKEEVDIFAVTDNSRIWLIPFDEIGHQTSVCLDSTNPNYKPQTKYTASDWLI